MAFCALGWLYGLQSLFSISKEASPSVDIPYYSVVTVYPWADPKTVDEQVTAKIAEKCKTISLVKKITSSSSYNMSAITVEFYTTKKGVDAMNDLTSAINQVQSSLPSDAKTPIVKKIDITGLPMYQFAVSWPYPSEVLYKKAQDLEDKIKQVAGVSEVTIAGKSTQQIKINFDLQKILQMDLDVWYVVSQLRGDFIKQPTDKKNIYGQLYSFEVNTYESTLSWLTQQIRNTDITNTMWRTVKVWDVAQVYNWYVDNPNKMFIVSWTDTVNAIGFAVSKTPWFDVQSLTLSLKAIVQDFQKKNPDLSAIELQTSEEVINKTYNNFLENFWETWLFVFLVVVVFLGRTSSVVVLVAFLLVYLINFMFLSMAWYTFNNIVSFSLILVLGIMVDNLIVVTQGIAIGLREKKWKMREAIWFALHNYWSAVLFWTLCTIVIFVPLLFWLTWIVGEYMKSFPIVIDSNLTISLAISLIGLPILFTYLYKKKEVNLDSDDDDIQMLSHDDGEWSHGWLPEKEFEVPKALRILERWWEWFGELFYNLNSSRKKSFLVLGTFWLLFVGSIMLIVFWFIKTDFLWDADSNNVWINMKYRAGISADENREDTQKVLQDVLTYVNKNYNNMIDYISVEIGKQNWVQWWWDTSNYSSITLKLHPMQAKWLLDLIGVAKLFNTDAKERTVKSYAMVEQLRQYIDESIKPKYSFLQEIAPVQVKWWPSGGKPIGFYIVWDDLIALGTYMANILPDIKAIPGVFNVSTNVQYSNGKIVYKIDPNKLKDMNTSVQSLITTLAGIKNSSYNPNGIPIKEFNDYGKDTIKLQWYVVYSGDIDAIKVWQIPFLKLVSQVSLEPELLSISRNDNQTAIKIEADKNRDAALWDVNKKVEAVIAKHPLPAGVVYKAAWDVESQDSSGKDLWKSIMIGIVLMYMVLLVLFKNFKYPTSIITSIFLSIWWAFLILAITWKTLNFPAELSLFGVLWVWVNQAIIHIQDFKVFYEKQWMSVLDSFRKSIAIRFVPIFLTKLTTILWLVILSFKDEVYWGLATAFIGGLLMSFFITLLYLPTLVKVVSKPMHALK